MLRRHSSRLGPVDPAATEVEEDHVFLLDDEPAVQAILRRKLEDRGLSVYGSTQWSEVASRVLEVKAGRVFLVADLNMPGIRGEDFCRIVQTYRPDVVLVLFTGAARAEVAAAAARLGNVPYVLKSEGAGRVCDLLEDLMRKNGKATS